MHKGHTDRMTNIHFYINYKNECLYIIYIVSSSAHSQCNLVTPECLTAGTKYIHGRIGPSENQDFPSRPTQSCKVYFYFVFGIHIRINEN